MEQRHREDAHAQKLFAKVERFLASILSQAEFCAQEGLAYWTFRYWLKQYRLREAFSPQAETSTEQEPEKPSANFIPLRIAPAEPAASSSTCEIEYPSGVVIRFSGPVNANVLAQLIHVTGDLIDHAPARFFATLLPQCSRRPAAAAGRKSFDGLSGLVTSVLSRDPTSGDVYVFLNRRRDRMKLLLWDRNDFSLFYKRLELGTFQLPPICAMKKFDSNLKPMGPRSRRSTKRKPKNSKTFLRSCM